MESLNKTEQQPKSVKEGGLEAGIEKMRARIEVLKDIIDQIEHLQKVPYGYKNLGEKVDSRELPALDQSVEYRGEYNRRQSESQKALDDAYSKVLDQLSLLRDMTGISDREEAMKFNKDTGRQEKDK